MRFSAWSTDSALPRRYESVQIAPGAPIMVSRRFGEWGYAQLPDGADSAILGGNTGGDPQPAHRQPRRLGDGRLLPRRRRDQGPLAADQDCRSTCPVGLSPVLIHLPEPDPDGEYTRGTTMATDVARLSFDPGRHYTRRGARSRDGSTLEAEQNEQRVIDVVERRKELLDIVGPAGTPDDGYAVSFVGGVVTVGVGTMYVGGLRVGARRGGQLPEAARLARRRRCPCARASATSSCTCARRT